MNIWSKRIFMCNKYRLLVTTNPSGATCTLTIDGTTYTTKDKMIEAGKIVSYTISDSTYGTKTGSFVMNGNKVMVCTGQYTSVETDQAWSNPTLSSQVSPGGSNFAAFMDSTYSTRYAYLMFDGQTGNGHFAQTAGTLPHYLGFYNPAPVKITSLTFNWYNASASYYSPKNGQLEASNDGSSYTTLQTFSYSSNPSSTSFTNPTNNYYKYYRIYGTDGGVSTTYACNECYASGYTKVQSISYYWDVTIN